MLVEEPVVVGQIRLWNRCHWYYPGYPDLWEVESVERDAAGLPINVTMRYLKDHRQRHVMHLGGWSPRIPRSTILDMRYSLWAQATLAESSTVSTST